MWWLLPLGMSAMSGIQKGKEAQRQNDLDVVRAGTGRQTANVEQPNAWESLSTGLMGGLNAQQEMAKDEFNSNFKFEVLNLERAKAGLPPLDKKTFMESTGGSSWSLME